MKNKIRYLTLSSAWVFYIGYLIYGFIISKIGFVSIFPTFFMGIIAPFWLWETGILALVLIIMTLFIFSTKWRHKWRIVSILQWGYLGLMFFSISVLANIV